MQQLIDLLQQKAGITEEQAIKTLETVKEYIQSKLPPMMHGMVDNFLQQDNSDEDDVIDDTADNDWSDEPEGEDKKPDWAGKAGAAAKDALGKLKSMMNDKDSEFQYAI